MSSWIVATNSSKRRIQKEITSYYDASAVSTTSQFYVDFLAAYLHSKKNNETCNIWDPSLILKSSIKPHPYINILKEQPTIEARTLETHQKTVTTMKFADIKKDVSIIFEYNEQFNRMIDEVLQLASMRMPIDLCIHLVNDSPKATIEYYVDLVKAYETKFNKKSLNIYIMANSYDTVTAFITLGNPLWKITSLSKFETPTVTSKFIQEMAEVKLMSAAQSMILDFSKPIDRLIYLLRKSKENLEYFKEINRTEWYLV